MSLSGRDGARLEHEQLAVLQRPLDVLRAAEALLEVDADLREADELRLVEGLGLAALGRQRLLADAAARVADDRVRLGMQARALEPPVPGEDVVVGVSCPDTTPSPSPKTASTTMRSRRPFVGSTVNRTPDTSGSTIRCTTTAIPRSRSDPFSRR